MSQSLAPLFRTLTTGVYVIGVADGDRRNAFTAAWVMQVSFQPLLLALSINPQHASYPLLRHGRAFTVNVLQRGQLALAQHFGTHSGREMDKLAAIAWRAGLRGAPILADALAFFACEVASITPAGDHQIVLGTVVGGGVLVADAVPLTYVETGNVDGSSELYPAAFPSR